MIESATGLVLRTRPLTETSVIVHWLTRDLGRMATVAKGARRAKSPFLGKIDLFYLADFTFSRSRRSDLHTLREIKLRGTNLPLRQELARLRQASYAAALVAQATETETPIPLVYDLMLGLLDYLPRQPIQPQTIWAFELKLLEELGLHPDLQKSHLKPGTKQAAEMLLKSGWPALPRLKLSEAQAKELGQYLHGFIIFHLGRIPKGRMAAAP